MTQITRRSYRRPTAARSAPRGRLCLTRLDDRTCPAVTITQSGTTLVVVGDPADDRMLFSEQTDGTVRVSANGGAAVPFAGVDRVVVRAGEGDNTVQVAGQGHVRAVVVETLTGRDRVEVIVPAANQGTRVAVSTGGGDDEVLVTLEGRTAAAGAFAVDLTTGDGHDRVSFGSTGVLHASVTGHVDLGAGNDALDAGFLVFDGNPDFRLAIKGRDGNDAVTAALGGPGALSRLAAVGIIIDNGFGDDSAIIVQNNLHIGGIWVQSVSQGDGRNFSTLEAHSVTVAGPTRLALTGGTGDDSATVMIGDANEFQGPAAVLLAFGGGTNAGTVMVGDANEFQALTVDIRGGAGIDDLAAQVGFNPQPDPPGRPLRLVVDGGGNADRLRLNLAESLGGVDARAVPVVAIRGGAGDDTVQFAGTTAGLQPHRFVRLDGGPGNDQVEALDPPGGAGDLKPMPADLTGGAGDDTVIGSGAAEVIDAAGGDDVVRAGGGDDRVSGGDGKDDVNGGDGNDTVSGGAGDDWVFGAAGDDHLSGGAGEDWVLGEAGDDFLSGGAGNDLLIGGFGEDRLEGDSGADGLIGGPADLSQLLGVWLLTDAHNDGEVDELVGGAGPDLYVHGSPFIEDDLIGVGPDDKVTFK